MPTPDANWFERLTGFREVDFVGTRALLEIDGGWLVSRVTGARHGIGRLGILSLAALRAAAPAARGPRTTVQCLAADVRALHRDPACAGALFQVASQFKLLEMIGPDVTPEDGVTRYAFDRTQGPACAMAAGAGTIWRHYFVPLPGGDGQTAQRQVDTLAPLGQALAERLRCPVERLWTMRNGYALATRAGLASIGRLLREADEPERETLRGALHIGLHRDVEVTDVAPPDRPRVTQAYCSALPVAYSELPDRLWAPFARLVLEAAYEATLLAAAAQGAGGGSRTVLLTRLGGGAFGNDDDWIDDALLRALRRVEHAGLDVVLVSHGHVHPAMQAIAQAWG